MLSIRTIQKVKSNKFYNIKYYSNPKINKLVVDTKKIENLDILNGKLLEKNEVENQNHQLSFMISVTIIGIIMFNIFVNSDEEYTKYLSNKLKNNLYK